MFSGGKMISVVIDYGNGLEVNFLDIKMKAMNGLLSCPNYLCNIQWWSKWGIYWYVAGRGRRLFLIPDQNRMEQNKTNSELFKSDFMFSVPSQ